MPNRGYGIAITGDFSEMLHKTLEQLKLTLELASLEYRVWLDDLQKSLPTYTNL